MMNSKIDPVVDINNLIEEWKSFDDSVASNTILTGSLTHQSSLLTSDKLLKNVNILFEDKLLKTNETLGLHSIPPIENVISKTSVISKLGTLKTFFSEQLMEYFQMTPPKDHGNQSPIFYKHKDFDYYLKHDRLNLFSFFYIKGVNNLFQRPCESPQIAYRNNIYDYSTFLMKIVTPISYLKHNIFNKFENGEVDFIFFKENNQQEDFHHFHIVFSGSNGSEDWKHNLTFSTADTDFKYPAHEGISKLWNTYSKKSLEAIFAKLKGTYESLSKRPKIIQISITGHSLGGALALMSAIYLKLLLVDKYEELFQIKVLIKVFQNGSPAIFKENEVGKVEKLLGKENIFHLFTEKDPVCYYSQFFSRDHLGTSFSMKNLTKTTEISNWTNFAYHNTERYRGLFQDYVHNPLFNHDSLERLELLKELKFEFENLLILRENQFLKQSMYFRNEIFQHFKEVHLDEFFYKKQFYFEKINKHEDILKFDSIQIIDIFEYTTSPLSVLNRKCESIEEKLLKIGSQIHLEKESFFGELMNEISSSDELSQHFYNGYLNFILKNYKKALFHLFHSYKHPYSQLLIGECFLNGYFFEKDEKYAFQCFRNSYTSENPISQYKLGFCYYKGVGCDVDLEHATQLFQMSSNQSILNGSHYLDLMRYLQNQSTLNVQNQLFESSKQHSKSQIMLGRISKKLNDEKKMFEWYNLSANQNNLDGLRSLAYCYYSGEGCKIDKTKFFELSLKASNFGSRSKEKCFPLLFEGNWSESELPKSWRVFKRIKFIWGVILLFG
jgi:hypothetical protein